VKKSLLISLVILLAVSLGITMVSPQSVKAQPPAGKFTFNIMAEGQGDWKLSYFSGGHDNGTGEFSFGITGEVSDKKIPMGRGHGYPPDAEVAGHVIGSFDGHTISVGLQGHLHKDHLGRMPVRLNEEWNDIPRLIQMHALTLRGSYDGEPIYRSGSNHFAVDDELGYNRIEGLLVIPDVGYLTIWIDETEADIFKFKIHEVGN